MRGWERDGRVRGSGTPSTGVAGASGSEGAKQSPLTCTKRSFSSLSMRTGSRTGRGREKAVTLPLMKSDHRLSGSPSLPRSSRKYFSLGRRMYRHGHIHFSPKYQKKMLPRLLNLQSYNHRRMGPEHPSHNQPSFEANFVSCSVTCPCWRQNQGRELIFSTTISPTH